MYSKYTEINDDKAKALLLARLKFSEDSIARQRFMHKVKKNHKLYECYTEDRYRKLVEAGQHWRSNTFLPMAYTDIESFIPDLIIQIFARKPIVTMEPRRTRNVKSAKIAEELNDLMATELGFFMKYIRGAKACAKQGVEIGIPYWKEEVRTLTKLSEKELSVLGIPILKLNKKVPTEYKYFSHYGVDFDWLDIFDAYPDPTQCEVKNMDYFIYRTFKKLDYLKFLASSEGGKLFKNVDKIKVTTAVPNGNSDDNRRLGEYVPPTKDKDGKVVLLHYYIEDDRLIVLANRDTIIYNGKNEEWDKTKHIVDMHCIPTEHTFWSKGLIDKSGAINNASNDFWNVTMDNARAIANQMLLIQEGYLKNPDQDLTPRPMGHIMLKNGAPINAVTPLKQGQMMGGTFEIMKFLSQINQDTTSNFGINKGRTERRETLGTNEMLEAAGSSRSQLMSFIMVQTGIIRLWEIMTSLSRKHMERGRLLHLVYRDGITGQDIDEYIDNANRELIPVEQLNYIPSISFRGSKEIHARRMLQMTNLYYGLPEIDNRELIKEGFEAQRAVGYPISRRILREHGEADARTKAMMEAEGGPPGRDKPIQPRDPNLFNEMAKQEGRS